MDYLIQFLPIITAIITAIVTWILKEKSEKLKLQREKLIEEKRQNYFKILEPMILSLNGIKNPKDSQVALKKIASADYRKTSFELMLIGSDQVVQAYNDFFQYLYKNPDNPSPHKILEQFGNVVLQIRKDLGNSHTKLERKDMLRFMINDIDKEK